MSAIIDTVDVRSLAQEVEQKSGNIVLYGVKETKNRSGVETARQFLIKSCNILAKVAKTVEIASTWRASRAEEGKEKARTVQFRDKRSVRQIMQLANKRQRNSCIVRD